MNFVIDLTLWSLYGSVVDWSAESEGLRLEKKQTLYFQNIMASKIHTEFTQSPNIITLPVLDTLRFFLLYEGKLASAQKNSKGFGHTAPHIPLLASLA